MKTYRCPYCQAPLQHSEAYPHWLKCPNRRKD